MTWDWFPFFVGLFVAVLAVIAASLSIKIEKRKKKEEEQKKKRHIETIIYFNTGKVQVFTSFIGEGRESDEGTAQLPEQCRVLWDWFVSEKKNIPKFFAFFYRHGTLLLDRNTITHIVFREIYRIPDGGEAR